MAGMEDEADSAEAEVAHSETAEESTVVEEQEKSDAAASDAPDRKDVKDSGLAADEEPATARVRRVSVSVRVLLTSVVIAALLTGVGVLTWLYLGATAKLDEQTRQAANDTRAEHTALDYAVGAAKIKFDDLAPWKKGLVKGTTPELNAKLSAAATSMEQILAPLQWDSTAVPLVAKVRSHANGIYVVDAFVSVATKTVQAPDAIQSTATYSVTIDSNHDWQISDVGGINQVVGATK